MFCSHACKEASTGNPSSRFWLLGSWPVEDFGVCKRPGCRCSAAYVVAVKPLGCDPAVLIVCAGCYETVRGRVS